MAGWIERFDWRRTAALEEGGVEDYCGGWRGIDWRVGGVVNGWFDSCRLVVQFRRLCGWASIAYMVWWIGVVGGAGRRWLMVRGDAEVDGVSGGRRRREPAE